MADPVTILVDANGVIHEMIMADPNDPVLLTMYPGLTPLPAPVDVGVSPASTYDTVNKVFVNTTSTSGAANKVAF
jgi:hypothetical protein